ncbi:MAG: hypothetical protein ACRDRC_08745, partial [Pseudonocardiaceae bacterium]
MRRELYVTDISAHCNVGGVEFTMRAIAAQVGRPLRMVTHTAVSGIPAITIFTRVSLFVHISGEA